MDILTTQKTEVRSLLQISIIQNDSRGLSTKFHQDRFDMFGAHLPDDLSYSPAANELNLSDLGVCYQGFCRLWCILPRCLDDIKHAFRNPCLFPGFSQAMMCFGT